MHSFTCSGEVSRESSRVIYPFAYPNGTHAVDGSGCNCLNRNGWALNSAVECHLHTVEVIGSNPIAPTIFSTAYEPCDPFLVFCTSRLITTGVRNRAPLLERTDRLAAVCRE